jgi:predicted  nucleic acid-binding Zn-ribbon protein
LHSSATKAFERRAAEHHLDAATIETALIKLACIRAEIHMFLYSHADMQNTLEDEYNRLKDEEDKLEAEESELDRQIGDYDRLLSMVEGESGEFSQIVDDWTRVKKETEECRRDLRRLGWTDE